MENSPKCPNHEGLRSEPTWQSQDNSGQNESHCQDGPQVPYETGSVRKNPGADARILSNSGNKAGFTTRRDPGETRLKPCFGCGSTFSENTAGESLAYEPKSTFFIFSLLILALESHRVILSLQGNIEILKDAHGPPHTHLSTTSRAQIHACANIIKSL